MKKLLPVAVIVVVLVGGGAFFGGMKYAESKVKGFAAGNFQNLRNLSPEQRQQRMQEVGVSGRGVGFLTGEILSKDEKSITIKLINRQGAGEAAGSKIVFFSNETKITKSAEGSLDDLKTGEQILVNGTPNADGSLTAQTIQLQPLPKM